MSPARRTRVAGLDYAYLDEGSGPPVVLVHGNPSWSFTFRDLVTALAGSGFRALAPDHVGMGQSAKPSPRDYPYSYGRHVDDLTAFLEGLGLDEPVTLVVHDWGGAIALAWAARHPELLRRVVLLNTAAFPLPAGMALPWHLRLARSRGVGDAAVLLGNAFARGATLLGVRRRLGRDVRRGYLAPYDRPAHRVGVLRFVRDVPASADAPAHALLAATGEALPRLLGGLPVLVCWGLRDPVLDARVLARWRQLLPSAEVHTYTGAGHYVHEDAGERVVPLVLDWLRRTSAPARAGT